MQRPTVIDAPSGGDLEEAPRWDLLGTGGCGSGNRVLWCSWLFSGYMSIYRRKKQVGWATTVDGAPLPRGPHVAPLHLFQHPHTSSSSRKNHHTAQTHVLAHFAAIFDLLAQSSTHKTALGDCSSVCDSSNGPISFCSSAIFIGNFCCLGDPVLELAYQIYMVKSSFNA